ncbi:hypothetical protein QR680_003727 [Steinernema hermaphroditum]|uniref:G-protein coupled receptors family 1 profile domain-containing protein n=1 Tax=Steinernema hermaphroditum TaxID=289476 RepID=A0AA39LSU1_9BILA|nr:hypothetical protein QR680_003727 [Steinernema hermaphroditum]
MIPQQPATVVVDASSLLSKLATASLSLPVPNMKTRTNRMFIASIMVTPQINIIMGFIYIFFSGMFIMVNAILLMITVRDSKYKSGTYRIIKNICVACIMQLIPFFVGGFMTLADSTFNYYLDRILGAIVESGWFLYISLAMALAVDRLLVFVTIVPSKYVYIINWTLLVGSWLFWLSTFIILLIPCFGYTYDGVNGHFVWVHNECQLALIMMETEMYLDFVFFFIDLVIYFVVFLHLIKIKLRMTHNTASFFVEIRIFIVAIISFVYESLFIIWSFWIPGFLSDPRAMDMVTNLMWIVDSGLFATVTLMINVSLRNKVKSVFVVKSHKMTTKVGVVTRASRQS